MQQSTHTINEIKSLSILKYFKFQCVDIIKKLLDFLKHIDLSISTLNSRVFICTSSKTSTCNLQGPARIH